MGKQREASSAPSTAEPREEVVARLMSTSKGRGRGAMGQRRGRAPTALYAEAGGSRQAHHEGTAGRGHRMHEEMAGSDSGRGRGARCPRTRSYQNRVARHDIPVTPPGTGSPCCALIERLMGVLAAGGDIRRTERPGSLLQPPREDTGTEGAQGDRAVLSLAGGPTESSPRSARDGRGESTRFRGS